jgi:glycogen operon protein
MHDAGIEVILDVVYNHTAEGNHLGPTVSLKGIDNQAYYRLVDDDFQHYMDYTGTGNSLNVRHPHSLQLIMDSLRYWVTEMHVTGSASISPRRWLGSSTRSTSSRRSSSSCSKTRRSRRSS